MATCSSGLAGGFFVACDQSQSSDSTTQDNNGGQLTADVDTDGDGVSDLSDNCNDLKNADQADADDDGYGDDCDSDPNDPNVPDAE